jgi:hypothetical protein
LLRLLTACVLPLVCLAAEYIGFGDFSILGPWRLFLYLGVALAVTVYLAAPAIPAHRAAWRDIAAGVMATAAVVAGVVGVSLVPATLIGLWVFGAGGVVLLFQEGPSLVAVNALEMCLVASLGLAPFALTLVYARQARHILRTQTGERAPVRHGLLIVCGAVAAIVAPFVFGQLLAPRPTDIRPLTTEAEHRALAAELHAYATSGYDDAATVPDTLSYRGTGSSFQTSPDRNYVAFVRSGADVPLSLLALGRHHIYVWDERRQTTEKILSFTEADPGSGSFFDYRWSDDSTALFFRGAGQIEGRERPDSHMELMYVVAERTWYAPETASRALATADER